jgi:hypothetical protein
MSRARAVAAYVTTHGFGHAVRTATVLERWLATDPDIVVHVRTVLPRRLFPPECDRLRFREAETDVGLLQRDCLSIDFAATIARLDDFERDARARIETEASWLRATGVKLVLGDIPPLAFAAAERADIPSVALGNFSWDWVYEHYVDRDPRFAFHAERAAERYRSARALLRLPFHGPMRAFEDPIDLPILAPRTAIPATVARRALGLPLDGPLVALSFGGIGFPGLELDRLRSLRGIRFVTTDRVPSAPPNVLPVDPETVDYMTLLAACDAVVSKPGYGIVATCLARGLRLLCAWRADFPEAPILVRALEQHGTAAFVSVETLASGAFGAELEELLARPAGPARLPADGAERAVEFLSRELAR